ncbi:peptidase M24 [Marinithermofilum abyssi]|uniref:Peptidase M24 n=1 Tax=Marinithermofilum abyssi TaxID=1571185 RepID=A0A8J2VHS3_9BACL|nr:Xaa-Pro peptidase family protein [Marinithermofilum abyssi]GGE10193.1 peptidase M24 [Marinithermofilum abyssi]
MERRLEKLRKRMEEEGVKAFLVSHPINRRYISGFTGSAGWVVVTADAQAVVTDFRYVEQVKEQSPNFRLVEHKGNPLATVVEECRRLGVQTLAFEENHLTYAQAAKLKEAAGEIALEPTNGLVEQIRQIKDEEELRILRRAVQIADDAFAAVLKELQPGKKETEIALRLEILMREMGATSSSFDIIVASGPRSAMPHGVASDRVMQRGDLVTLDFGALYQGYCSDITRTVMLGQPNEKQREIYEIVLDAQKRAVAAIRPGITGKEEDAVARDLIREQGYGDAFGHSTGHGLGMEVHEAPGLSSKSDTVLEPGMVVTVEPGIYLPDVGGVRIEDDVLVTPKGHEVLTQSPKDMIIID